MSEQPVVCGIDEAGLGPLLGPLTIGWSAFEVDALDSNPWELARAVVSKKPADDKTRFVVADSKVVYSRNARGRKRLEHTALGFLSLLRDGQTLPPDKGCVWGVGLGRDTGSIVEHPWYRPLRALPMWCEAESLELRASRLAKGLLAAGVRPLDAGVRVLPAGELNRAFEHFGNKAGATWHFTVAVLAYLRERFVGRPIKLDVDLQGGRRNYGPLLAQALPRDGVVLVDRDEEGATYRLERRGEPEVLVEFRAKHDDRSFPVALASCLAKYAREIAMDDFNAFFGELDGDLKPTAGYTQDGRRWLEDAAEAIRDAAVSRGMLVRSR